MAVTVQRGTITLANGASSVTVDQGVDPGFDTAVTVARTICRVTARTAGTDVNTYTNYLVAWVLTNGTTLTISRSGTTSDVVCEWELIEFESGQLVAQPVVLTFTGTTGATAAINAASIGGGRWIESNGWVTGQENSNRSTANVVFNSTTEVGATRVSATGTVTMYATVYEHIAATVQTVQATLPTNTETDHDETISAVTVAKTLVVGTVRDPGSATVPASGWQCRLTSTTNLRWSRLTGTSLTFVITCFVVSFSDDTAVQQHTIVHGTGVANPVDTTITAVTMAESSLYLSGMFLPSIGASLSASAWSRSMSTVALTTTTNVAEQKGVTTTDNTQYLQTVSWGAAAPAGPTITDQPDNASVVLADGNTASFTVAATGTGDLGYQWSVDDGGGYDEIVGATAATLNLTGVVIGQDGYLYRCAVEDDNGTTNSSAAELSVSEGPAVDPASGTTDGSAVETTSVTTDIASRVQALAYCNGVLVGNTTVLYS